MLIVRRPFMREALFSFHSTSTSPEYVDLGVIRQVAALSARDKAHIILSSPSKRFLLLSSLDVLKDWSMFPHDCFLKV